MTISKILFNSKWSFLQYLLTKYYEILRILIGVSSIINFSCDIDILKLYVTRSEDTFCYRDIKFDSFDISHVKVGYL